MKVYLETLGCQMNRLDSELLAGLLRRHGHDMVATRRGADAVVYNTCSVRDHAEQKVLSRLGAHQKRRDQGRSKPVIAVLGCMAQRMGSSLVDRFDCVDVVCAPGQIYQLPELLSAAADQQPRVECDPPRNGNRDLVAEAAIDRLDLTRDPSAGASAAQAYVRVARGCDNFCTYCIVPFVRGPERSRSPHHITEEVRRLVDAGRTEITLLGQTVNRYRWSDGGTTERFSDLLARLAPIPGLRRLRFVTSHPVDFPQDILDAMRDLPNVCPYIHCPAQSGSNAVLKRMHRGYTRQQYEELIQAARETVPGVVFAGDFIVGFPGETQADHEASVDLLRFARYKNAFIFKYSPRPDTAAARMVDDVPERAKKQRNNELLAIQKEIGLAHHQEYTGQVMEVLVSGPSPRSDKQPTPPPPGCIQLAGRTVGDHIVIFDGPEDLADEYVRVRITDGGELTLFGELEGFGEE